MGEQILFILVLAGVIWFSYKLYSRVFRAIKLGKPEELKNNKAKRWRRVFLVAFGQKKMFKRPIPALLHLFIYIAFLFTQIELIEILFDGFTGKHRILSPYLGGFYTVIITFVEVLSVLAFIGTVAFLYRRNILKVPRLSMKELAGWPKKDANLILLGEILLIIGIFTMNGSYAVLQHVQPDYYPEVYLPIGEWLGKTLFAGADYNTLIVLERLGWWLHMLVVFGFLLYLPYSKHLHIFFAFPSTYYARTDHRRGHIPNMPAIMNEVKSMMDPEAAEVPLNEEEEIPQFGAGDVTDLPQRIILQAFACTECGRCTDECPANRTGKLLSPRKIMMDIRDRAEEIIEKLDEKNEEFFENDTFEIEAFDDGKDLFSYISREEIYACTSCNACIEACPVLINPLEPIFEMRRFDILTNSQGPSEWMPMFSSIENNGSPWQIPEARDAWKEN